MTRKGDTSAYRELERVERANRKAWRDTLIFIFILIAAGLTGAAIGVIFFT